MFLHLRLFRRALYLSLVKSPFRLRRWAYVLFFTGLFLMMWVLVALGRALDHLFFPGFRRQPIIEPVFIVAPPRSGTTLTQKLFSLDDERFVHVKLYQTIFPAVCFQRACDAIAWLDRDTGRGFSRLASWLERKFFGGWDSMHKLRWNEPEEDDGFFLYCFVSEGVYLLFPHIHELWEAGFADALPPADRRKVMHYYRSCLQRHLYANGPRKTLLSKATQSSGAVESLREEFPDAKFITIVRHPYQSIASHVSVFYPAWHAHSPEIAKDSDVSRAYAKLAVCWYQHLFQFRSQVDPTRYFCLDYRDLVQNPRNALEKIYQHFGWTPSAVFQERMDHAVERQRTYNSQHRYSLEEFGLSREWIDQELRQVIDYYKLESGNGAVTDPSATKSSASRSPVAAPTRERSHPATMNLTEPLGDYEQS